MTLTSKILTTLSPPQKTAFHKAINLFQPSQNVLKYALQYYQKFLTINDEVGYSLDDVVNGAIFMAENMDDIRDLTGKKVRGIGFSANKMIKGCESIISGVQIVNQYLSILQFTDFQLQAEIKQIVEQIIFIQKQARFFQQKIEALELEEKVSESYGYKETFRSLAWLLFVDSRENVKKIYEFVGEEESSCLMASIFYLKIRYSLEYIKPKKVMIQGCSTKELITKILDYLLQVFEIENIELFKEISQTFDEYFEQMIAKSIMRVSKSQTDFFSPYIININYKRLDSKYQKALLPNDIDCRLFWKDKILTLTPARQNPHFQKQKKSLKGIGKMREKKFQSHRMLNYDEEFESNEPEEQIERVNTGPILIKPQTSSPQMMSNSFPIDCNSDIYRYIFKKIKKAKNRKLHAETLKFIQQAYLEFHPINSKLNQRSNYLMTYTLYLAILDQCLNQPQPTHCIQENFIYLSMEIVTLLYCPPDQFHEVRKKYELTRYADYLYNSSPQILACIWFPYHKLLDDAGVPEILRNYLKDIVEDIIEEECWMQKKFIDEIAELAANYPKHPYFVEMIENVMLYGEYVIKVLGLELNLGEQICEGTYNCLKYIMSVCGEIIYRQKLDQVILCSLYITCKKIQYSIKFADIRCSYEKFFHQKSSRRNTFFDFSPDDGIADIIAYYNKIFLPAIKPFLPYLIQPCLNHLHPIFQNPIFKEEEEEVYRIGLNGKPVNLNIIKEESLQSKYLSQYQKQHNMQIDIETSNRNQTRVRIRPSLIYGLCETEKMKQNSYQ